MRWAAAFLAWCVTLRFEPERAPSLEDYRESGRDEIVGLLTCRDRPDAGELAARCADAFLALPGGIGTLEELFEVWTAGSLGMHSKPVVVLDDDDFYRPLWAFLEALRDRGFVRAAALDHLIRVRTVEEAFTAIERAWAATPPS